MKKLLGLLSAASLIATTGASVVSCGFVSRTSNSDDNNGNDEKEDEDNRDDLSIITEEWNLGALENWENPQNILNLYGQQNSNIDIKEINVDESSITKWGATINANDDSKLYKGYVRVMYNMIDPQNLSDIITIKDLGKIKDADEETIKGILANKYPDTLNVDAIKVERIPDENKVRITASDLMLYEGVVELTYTLPTALSELVPLNSHIRFIENADENTILDTVVTKFGLIKSDVYISEIDIEKNSATVTSKEESVEYKGYSSIYFATEQKDLSELFKVTSFTNARSDSDKDLISALKNIVPDLSSEDVVISDTTETSFTLTAAPESKVYTGSVKFEYTIDHRISIVDVIGSGNHIGNVTNEEPETILQALKLKYTDLKIEEIHVETIGAGSAIIAANDDSTYYKAKTSVFYNLIIE